MTFAQTTRRRLTRRLALGLAVAAVAMPSTAQALVVGSGPRPSAEAEQATTFNRDSPQTAIERISPPVSTFNRDSSQTAAELANAPRPVVTGQPVQPAASHEWRAISIGLAATLGALLAALVGVGIARRQRRPVQAT